MTVRTQVPAGGGHGTVRIADFDEHSAPPIRSADGLGRFVVVLRRQDGGPVRVSTVDGGLLGHLPTEWSCALDSELVRCESRGLEATARASLAGRRDERDLFVMLAWPGHRPGR